MKDFFFFYDLPRPTGVFGPSKRSQALVFTYNTNFLHNLCSRDVEKKMTRKPPEYLSIFTTRLRCSVLLWIFIKYIHTYYIHIFYFFILLCRSPWNAPVRTYTHTYKCINIWNIMTLSPCPEQTSDLFRTIETSSLRSAAVACFSV